jgi:uncharacterized phage protein (TIGR02218 family)
MNDALLAHLKTGSTTICRAWKVRRRDGQVLGFTDHDNDLTFDGVVYAARTGLTAKALQQSTGLSVDNSEASGALTDAAVREEDILAGRYDGAEVTAFQVNWENVEQRSILFRGTFGEIVRSQGGFRVELRGLTEALNRPIGQVFHAECSAVLGDQRCRVNLADPAFTVQGVVRSIDDGRVLEFDELGTSAPGWFIGGQVLQNIIGSWQPCGTVKQDRMIDGRRRIELWQQIPQPPELGESLMLQAGCDKRSVTCRTKFANFLNFRGFPHIPGEDWLRSAPAVNGRG